MRRTVFVFRQLDVAGSVRFGFSIVLQYLHFWLIIGSAWAWLAPTLRGIFWEGRPPFWGAALLFFLIGLWPLAVSARGSAASLLGGSAGIGTLLDFGAIFSLLLPWAMIVGLSSVAGVGADWVLTRLVGKGLVPFLSELGAPLSAMGVLKFYPLACLGAVTVAVPFSFVPWVAVDKGEGLSASLEWGDRLARDVKMELLFLQSLMFFSATVGFVLGHLLRGPKFPENIGAYVIYAMVLAFVGGTWTDAYRQALAYEEPEETKKAPQPPPFAYKVD